MIEENDDYVGYNASANSEIDRVSRRTKMSFDSFKIRSLNFEKLIFFFFASFEILILFSTVLRLVMSDKIVSATNRTSIQTLCD